MLSKACVDVAKEMAQGKVFYLDRSPFVTEDVVEELVKAGFSVTTSTPLYGKGASVRAFDEVEFAVKLKAILEEMQAREDTSKPLAVGDELAFKTGKNSWRIETITKITPSGRIKCGPYELNPDLKIRGTRQRGYWGPYSAERVTDLIRRRVEWDGMITRLSRIDWRTVDVEVLKSICGLLADHERGE